MFNRVADLHVRLIPYSELATHSAVMTRVGQGSKAVEVVALELV